MRPPDDAPSRYEPELGREEPGRDDPGREEDDPPREFVLVPSRRSEDRPCVLRPDEGRPDDGRPEDDLGDEERELLPPRLLGREPE